jgi:hypothetical protein
MPRRRSTAYQAAETTLKYAGWAGNRLYNWATTDHSGLGSVFDAMPHLGLIDGLMHLIAQIIVSLISILFGAIVLFVMVAYGLPFLLTGGI